MVVFRFLREVQLSENLVNHRYLARVCKTWKQMIEKCMPIHYRDIARAAIKANIPGVVQVLSQIRRKPKVNLIDGLLGRLYRTISNSIFPSVSIDVARRKKLATIIVILKRYRTAIQPPNAPGRTKSRRFHRKRKHSQRKRIKKYKANCLAWALADPVSIYDGLYPHKLFTIY